MASMPNAMGGSNDQGFFRQMAQRRIGARRPAPRPPAGGFGGAPAQPAVPMGNNAPMPAPAPPPPAGNAPMPPMGGALPSIGLPRPPANNGGQGMAAMGFKTYSGGPTNMGGGPMENLFMALPQGTEELFGAAPAGFNKTLRPGNGNMGGMF